ncbi:ELAV-like protein 3 [Acropora cervicornis]|uniref:ELAV-like protein 3 n=1 Tax=Acropora cervicornis TaxID=6130 RepID=A0AAD9QYS1_ACRCE|nr:PREDICTED: ELAV-like protein 3 [Acropora digitifera]XP_029200122.1 ELAV-like protein 3 [Acropora millepora]KAK2569753.1 ELAV-like protein 3 [Acropora cervicornis]
MLDKMNEGTPVQINGESLENGTDHGGHSKTNLIINYLPPSMSEGELKNLFGEFGTVSSCKLIRDRVSGNSLGYAFVNYLDPDHAAKAVRDLNKLRVQSKNIKVSYARPSSDDIKNANLYISGLPKTMTEQQLEMLFQKYGEIITSKVLKDENSQSRGAGFVRFDKRSQAQAAIDSLNGAQLPGENPSEATKLTVKFANPPSNKPQIPFAFQSPLSLTPPQIRGNARSPFSASGVGPLYHQGANFRYSPLTFLQSPNNNTFAPNALIPGSYCVFVYGLPSEKDDAGTVKVDPEKLLYKLFAKYGAISDVRVKKGQNFGFVNMQNYDDAQQAIAGLNGHRIAGHEDKPPLQVSFKTPNVKKQ